MDPLDSLRETLNIYGGNYSRAHPKTHPQCDTLRPLPPHQRTNMLDTAAEAQTPNPTPRKYQEESYP